MTEKEVAKLSTGPFGSNARISPTQMLIDALPAVKDAGVAVLIYRDRDDYIHTGWSSGALTERVGMLEMAKLRMIDSAQEDHD